MGKASLNALVAKVVEVKPLGSIEFLRKQLNLKKIIPIKVAKKIKAKVRPPLSKSEKLSLSAHFNQDEIPKSSF